MPNDTESDAALVARMAAGDEHALGVLYDRWATTVHTIAYYLLGQADDAEDAVEETFWQAWREAGRYDASRGAVSTWCRPAIPRVPATVAAASPSSS